MRTCEGISQAKLANELRISRTYLSEIESGRRTAGIELLRGVASYFEVPLALLVAWEGDAGADSALTSQLQELFSKFLSIRLKRMRNMQ